MKLPEPTGKIAFYVEHGTGNLVVTAGMRFAHVTPIPVCTGYMPVFMLVLRAKGWRFLGAA